MNAVKNKEILTDDKMRQIFGANYSEVLYFNFDNGRWNRRKYRGYKISDQFLDTNNAKLMKVDFDACAFAKAYELAALAVRNRGRTLIGGVLLRDLKSGKINKKADWFCFDRRLLGKQGLADCLASLFMYKFLYEDTFKQSVLSILNRSR